MRIFDPVPIAYRIIAGAVLFFAAIVFGYVEGVTREGKKLDEYKAVVSAQADQQAKHTQQVIAANQTVTKEAADVYTRDLDNLRKYYAGRMRNKPSASPLPAVPEATGKPDAAAADPLPAECAETTLQLEALQGWIKGIEDVR